MKFVWMWLLLAGSVMAKEMIIDIEGMTCPSLHDGNQKVAQKSARCYQSEGEAQYPKGNSNL